MPRKSVVRLTDRPDMTLDVYRGLKTTIHQHLLLLLLGWGLLFFQEFLQIYIVGLLLFLKDVSGTPIFKILVPR